MDKIFYSCNIIFKDKINKDSQEFLKKIYPLINVNTIIKKNKIKHPLPTPNTYIQKSYYYRKENQVTMWSIPPRGPINDYTYCPHCNQIGPSFHDEECQGPYDQEVLTDEGIDFYEDKIKFYFPEIDDPKEYDFFYKQIFPKRGIQKIISDKWKISNFPNSIQLKFHTSSTDKYPEGITVVSKLNVSENNKLQLQINRIPLNIIKPEDVIKTFITDKLPFIPEKLIINNSTITEKITEDNQILLLEDIYKKLKMNQNFSTTYSSYYNLIKVSQNNIKWNIKIGGTIQVWITKQSIQQNLQQNLQQSLQQSLEKIKIEDKHKEKIDVQTSLYYDKKILNTTIPYTLKNKKLKYNHTIKKGRFPPQPGTCQNRIPKANILKKADIKRPIPFSFSKGKPPTKGLKLIDEGKPTTAKKLLGTSDVLYEPCCETIKGVSPTEGNFFTCLQTSHNIITEDEIEKMKNYKKPKNEENIENKLKDWLKKSTSTKESMIRRLFYGFPNKIHPDDKAELHNIEEGFEAVPINEYKDNCDFNYKKQEDIKSAVYVPGTQLKQFKGNGKLIRDSRIYHGLLSLLEIPSESAKNILLDLIRNYFSNFHIEGQEIIHIMDKNDILTTNNYTIVDEDGEEKHENKKLTKKILDNLKINQRIYITNNSNIKKWWYHGIQQEYIKKTPLQFKIKKKHNDEIASISLPNGNPISNENIYFFPYKDKENCIFIPKGILKNLEKNKTYNFAFNYYIDTTGTFIVPNQPFIYVNNNIKEIFNDVEERLHYALDELFE